MLATLPDVSMPSQGLSTCDAAIEASAARRGARSPGGVAYTAGVRAHGKATMARLSKLGRKRAAKRRKRK